ncbi:allantoate permease [Ilyonectria destructans]|nr:allantoate permease [Ilyonectria destructans]
MTSSTDPEKYVGDDVATNKAADLANTIATVTPVLEVNQDAKAQPTATDDVARRYYLESKDLDISEAEERRVLRKIDLYLLPMMMGTGFLQYLDKSTINYAAIYNLQGELGMVGDQYSWASSIFYFGFLFWQYPSLLLLQRFPVGKYFASQVLAWGVFTLLMASTSNFGGFAALRFLLGAAESIQLAAFFIMTNMYYNRAEQPLRLMAWYAMSPLAIIVGSMLAYGVGHMDNSVSLWKFPFIICGSISFVWGVLLLFFLPNNPASAWFLNERERAIAVRRLGRDQNGIESKTFKKEQAVEALTDPKVWLAAVGAGAGNILTGIGLFQSLVIRSFGFSRLETSLLQTPTGGIEIIGLIIVCVTASKVPNTRMILCITSNLISLVGAIMLYVFNTEQKWALMAGFWVMLGLIPCNFVLGLGTTTANISGHTKKVTTQAIIFIFYSVGCIIGPQLYTTPPYRQGLRANVVALCVTTVTSVSSLLYFIWENRKRRRFLEENRHQLDEQDYTFRDLTDKQNPFTFNAI